MKFKRPRHLGIVVGLALVVSVVTVVLVLQHAGGANGLGLISAHSGSSYFFVALLVFADAVCPVFPGETTVNAASTLAAQGSLDLPLVMVAAALGAVIGDSALYWIARRFSKRIQPQIEKAKSNDKVDTALGLLGNNAPLLLIAGRFVPGVRFVVNATLGASEYPYRKFLAWSALGGTLWSVYTCLLAYAVGTVLDNFPLASTVISGLITTVLLAVILWMLARQRAAARART